MRLQNNAEIRFRWAMLGIQAEHEPTFAHARAFLASQGKQKFTVPLYEVMVATSATTRALAADIFAQTQASLHISLRNRVAAVLGK